MASNITAWTSPTKPPAGKVVPFVSINAQDDGRVGFTVRNGQGEMVTVQVPDREFGRMVRDMFAARGVDIGMNGGPPLHQ